MAAEGVPNENTEEPPKALRWYRPLVGAARLVGPLGVLLYALDGHPVRDFFTVHFLRYLTIGIVGGSLVLYAGVGLARWRRRAKRD